MEWIYIFLAGVVLEILGAIWTRAVAKKKMFIASVSTFFSENISCIAIITILGNLYGDMGLKAAFPYILDYSFGAVVGTMIVISDKTRLKKALKTTAMYFF